MYDNINENTRAHFYKYSWFILVDAAHTHMMSVASYRSSLKAAEKLSQNYKAITLVTRETKWNASSSIILIFFTHTYVCVAADL